MSLNEQGLSNFNVESFDYSDYECYFSDAIIVNELLYNIKNFPYRDMYKNQVEEVIRKTSTQKVVTAKSLFFVFNKIEELQQLLQENNIKTSSANFPGHILCRPRNDKTLQEFELKDCVMLEYIPETSSAKVTCINNGSYEEIIDLNKYKIIIKIKGNMVIHI